MLSHIYLGTNDPVRSEAFYAPIMALLGWRLRFSDSEVGWAGWAPATARRPLFITGRPYDGCPANPANGGMIALQSPDRATVDAVFALALRGGGEGDGDPAVRPHYHRNFYGAYFRDPDGNKMCICCHEAPVDANGETRMT